jgi:hypothetical protein
MQLD